MRPNDLLIGVSGENGTVSIVAKSDSIKIRLVGASVPTSVAPPASNLNSLTIAPLANKKGIIAVELTRNAGYGKNATSVSLRFFLHVENAAGKTEINLNDEWFPTADRLGHIIDDDLEVNVDGKLFTTDDYYDPNFKYESIRKTGKCFIPNGGVLFCQYLIGDVPAQAIVDMAMDTIHEVDALAEAAELRKSVKQLQAEADSSKERLGRANKENQELRKRIEVLEKSRQELNDLAHELNDLSDWKPRGKAKRRSTNMRIVNAYNV